MQALQMSGKGKSWIRGKADLHPHAHASVMHPMQFGTIPEAKPDESKPCPGR